MASFQECMHEYRELLQKGHLQRAYKGLMDYMLVLKTQFKNKYPEYFVSGSLYPGYMDMTYFSVMPEPLKSRSLKVAVVFLHQEFRFEVWLGGYNKQVQAEYWKLFKESGWNQYRIVPSLQGMDSFLEHTLVDQPDFSDLEALTEQIERGTLKFIADVEEFLEKQPALH